MPQLVALSYSPWSEKARWALDHHQINYREREYMPMLGTPVMRLMLRRPRGTITVPVLFIDGDALTDSYDIAQYGDSVGSGTPLFPGGADSEIAKWNRLSEQALSGSRALATWRAADNEQVLQESVPKQIPGPIRKAVGHLGVRYLSRKYRMGDRDLHSHRAMVREALTELDDALAGDRDTILDDFSYADLAMAVALQMVCPVANEYIRLGRHTRACMTDDELCDEFPVLPAWRDRVYEAHRDRG